MATTSNPEQEARDDDLRIVRYRDHILDELLDVLIRGQQGPQATGLSKDEIFAGATGAVEMLLANHLLGYAHDVSGVQVNRHEFRAQLERFTRGVHELVVTFVSEEAKRLGMRLGFNWLKGGGGLG